MTHHAPLRGSIADAYDGDPVTAAFASDLDMLVSRHRPAAWVHGHTHGTFAYRHAGCLVVCNLAGYTARENPAFDPGLVLEIPSGRGTARLVPGP
jgi:Icc-related predicted phosphoesterase